MQANGVLSISNRVLRLTSIASINTAMTPQRQVGTENQRRARAERDRLLMNEGAAAVRAEHQVLRHQLDEKIAGIQPHLTTIKLAHGADGHEYIIRTERASLNFYLYATAPFTDSRIVVQEFDGSLIFPGDRGGCTFVHGEGPRRVSERGFYFDYQAGHGWCWRQHSTSGALLATSDLCEYLIKRVLELHEKLKTGKPVPRPQRYGPAHPGPWS